MKTNIKLKVTPEQSEAVQQICFANGTTWLISNDIVSYTDAEYLYIEPGRLWFRRIGTSDERIRTADYTEIDADLFIRTNGTCEESIDIVDNLSNSKSKEDMFKQYGFQVPDFNCTILAKVGSWLIGYTQTDSMAPIPAMWFEHTGEYSGSSNLKVPNLTPIKKPWYETCTYPVIVKTEDSNIFIIRDELQNYTEVTLKTLTPLSNEEIDQLKQDF